MVQKTNGCLGVVRKLALDGSNKTIARQLVEIVALFLWSRLGPGFYLKAKMYQKNYPLQDVLGFLSLRGYKKRVNQLNDRLYHKCSQNKSVEKAILTTYGISTPELLGHYHSVRGFTTDGRDLRTKEHLQQLFERQTKNTKICIKLIDSWGGKGFRIIKCLPAGRVVDVGSGKDTNFEDFFKTLKKMSDEGLVIERYLEQHSSLSEFNSTSVNTMRVLVKSSTSGVECISAYLRVGRRGLIIDNASAGGIIFPVTLDSGVIGRGHTKHDRILLLDSHPDSNILMCGKKMPFFTEGVELAKRTLLVFPNLNFAGVDVAFSEKGPVVLEMNIEPDYNDFADCSIPSRKALM